MCGCWPLPPPSESFFLRPAAEWFLPTGRAQWVSRLAYSAPPYVRNHGPQGRSRGVPSAAWGEPPASHAHTRWHHRPQLPTAPTCGPLADLSTSHSKVWSSRVSGRKVSHPCPFGSRLSPSLHSTLICPKEWIRLCGVGFV